LPKNGSLNKTTCCASRNVKADFIPHRMKTICITGLLPDYNDAVMDILVRGGVQPALQSTRDHMLDMRTWHERLARNESGMPSPGYEPGRLWEQLAGDIFLANLHVPMWGWADRASLGLLDFWRDFDAGVHFLLLHVPVEQWLADRLAEGATDPKPLLVQWERATEAMLRFHLRNQARSCIVDATLAVQAPQRLLEACRDSWSLPLATQSARSPAVPEQGILPAYLATRLAAAAGELADLQHEIDATCIDLGLAHVPAAIGDADVLAEYRRQAASMQQLVVCTEEMRQAKLSHTEQSQRAAALETQNGQLLSRLQAIQEELKAYQVELKAVQEALQAAARAQETQRTQHQKQLADSRREHEAVRAGLERDNAHVLLQFTSVQEDLELALQAHQQDVRSLATVRADAGRLVQELKEATARLQHLEQRAARMELRLPGFVDYQSLALLPIEQEGSGLAHCRVAGLECGGGRRDAAFTVLLENGIAGFTFEQASQSLTRWPHAAKEREVVDIIPTSHRVDSVLRAVTLMQLSTSDWLLTQQLIGAVTFSLSRPDELPEEIASRAGDIRRGLAQLHGVLAQLPLILRFDRAELVRAYVSDDYEHLEIQLHNVMLGTRHSAQFVFRLACANVPGTPFGGHPRLEFPDGRNTALFEQWFEESSNIHGPKLELRFAKPDLMDLHVWQQISPADQALITALCDQLEDIVGMASAGDTAGLARDWSQWTGIAADMRRTLALRSIRKAPDTPAIDTLS
jgi:hypothetical protein